MTYRERREARAERLREWAAAREVKSAEMHKSAEAEVAMIPPGQPIHGTADRNRRERSWDRLGRAIETGRKGEEMAARADEIDRQAANAIYSDDADAPERLREKIAKLEAERERIKAYNASCRKAAKTGGTGDESLLDEKQREGLASLRKYCAYQVGKGGSLPAYELSNLGGNITRLRQRLARIERERERGPVDRIITARFQSSCELCGASLGKGEQIRYNRQDGARCITCEGSNAAA